MNYKKIKAILMTLILSSALALSSCGKTAEAPDASTDKEEKEDKEDKEDKKDREDDDEKTDTKESDKAAKEAYQAFLDGTGTVFFDESITEKNKAFSDFTENYTIQELADLISIKNHKCSMPDSVSESKWSYIDCGGDGISELALDLVYNSWYEYESPADEIFIIKNTDEGLKICYYGTGYYRTTLTVYDNGYISYGGSSGAAIYDEDEYVIDAEGNQCVIYSVENFYGLSETRIPPDLVPDEIEEKTSQNFSYGDKYQVTVYRFPDETPESNGEEWDYAAFARCGYYVFYDYDGNEVKVDDDYIELCEKEGIKIVTDKEINKIIERYKKDFGLDPKEKRGNEVTWESADAVSDNYSVANQTKLMADNDSVWMWRAQNEDFFEVSYAITDLNHNGRLEVIRCEKYPDDNTDVIARSYIYEVDEDLAGVTEWTFEQDHDSYISFLPVYDENDYLSINVFYKNDEGKFIYIVPTKKSTGYGFDELNLIMEVGSEGNAKVTGVFSKRVVGMEDDDIFYLHDKEVSESEYLYSDTVEYPLSDGYNYGQQVISFENFETSDDLLTSMRQSADWNCYFSMIEEAD